MTYDDLNRLWSASGLYGSQSYTYDGVGNRLTRVVGSTMDTYAYSPAANQIGTVTTGSNVRSFSYLASGQVSQDARDASDTYTFAANDNGRNASASLNGSTVGSYLYNAFEQWVQKTASSTTTQFVFDRAGHLLEETNGATGAAIREYIWLDDLPVAMVDDTGASPVLYFIHTDQLGTPQKITDGNANIVWEGLYDPFGNMITITGANWGTGVWGSFDWAQTSPPVTATNLRFPGQYADAETALNQNWNRDYDPTIGRYVQSDPIGLTEGVNTYSYALNNSVTYFDPTGKCTDPDPCVPPGANGPGWVYTVGAGFWGGVGVSVTSAGEIYTSVGATSPGVSVSAIRSGNMAATAGGWGGQGGYYGAGMAAGTSRSAFGGGGNFSLPVGLSGFLGYGFNFGHGLCQLMNALNKGALDIQMNAATNDEWQQ
jgi:RHS repeat-associated protein